MGREISLFSGYDQKENRTTNYCLLMLRQVYEESPRLLAEALDAMVGGDIGASVGVSFRQQEKVGKSVPDGLISQPSFNIVIEAKNHDWFYWDQIDRHLQGLDQAPEGARVFVALSNFEHKDQAKFDEIEQRVAQQYGDRIQFAAVSFEEFLAALEGLNLSPRLQATLAEFRGYLVDHGLLSSWRCRLEIVNCGGTMHEIEAGAYLCPATGGSYWHQRARYFGTYQSRRTAQLREIYGVVDVHEDARLTKLHWNNGPLSDGDLIARATEVASAFRADSLHDHERALVLGPSHPTDFRKDSSGGMFGTKRYFRVPDMEAPDLAEFLRDKTWSDLRKGR